MADYTNFGLSLLENADAKLEKDKKKPQYNVKHHEEVKTAIYLLKQQFMMNRKIIQLDCTPAELESIAKSQYITMQGKTWSVLHEEVIILLNNKGKGTLTITEVEVIEE